MTTRLCLFVSLLLCGCAPKANTTAALRLASESAANSSLTFTISTNPPAQDFRVANDWFISRTICWTAVVNYAVSAGSWLVEWNYQPMPATATASGFLGMNWVAVSPEIAGPGSGVLTLPVPPEPTGFFRLRKV